MSREAPSAPTVLVTDAGRGSAISIIRSLGRKGYRVIAADADRRSPGFCSRYTWQRLVYPPPETESEAFVGALVEAARRSRVDVMIPVTDPAILPLSAAREKFDGLCTLALPSRDALEAVTNKQKTLELAEQLGVPVPRTARVTSAEEALRAAPSLGWPVVLKPQASRLVRAGRGIEGLAVTYAETPDRLAERMRRFEGRCPVLLQEYVRGGAEGVELLVHEGRPLATFQHRRLREVPLCGGPSALRESVPLDPQLFEYSVRLLEAIHWTGLAMVEFKVGPEGARLMEINGRIWGSLPLAVHAGMDFPARLAELLLAGPPPAGAPLPDYRVGVRSRNLELDLVWIASVLTRRQPFPFAGTPGRLAALAALAGLLSPACNYDILSLEDVRPGLADLLRMVRKFVGKLRG